MAFDPRKSTLYILNKLDATDNTLDNILETVFSRYPDAPRRDKALLFAITYGVLRWRQRIDWVIASFSKTKIKKINPKILNILRIGLFQIMYMDRIPVSAAVNTAVDLAKSVSAAWVVRYVNGVLRNASKGFSSVALPDPQKEPVKALAVSQSFPEWLVQKWIDRFGYDETQALCHAMNLEPDITLRVNKLKTGRDDLIKSLSKYCEKIMPTPYCPYGVVINSPGIPIAEMAPFAKGHFSVQDEAAQAVSHLLNPKTDETVLDACCGLGGKTGHLAQLMKNKGRIVALDNNEKRLSALKNEMQRLGIDIVTPEKQDLSDNTMKQKLPGFDQILLDAPCSSLGVIRRNPDTKWRASLEKIKKLGKTQQNLLNHCAKMLKPGGAMVYVVCSMEPEENEIVIQSFLNNHSDFFIETTNPLWPDWIKNLIDPDGFLRTFPHKHQTDGFFAVRMKRLK